VNGPHADLALFRPKIEEKNAVPPFGSEEAELMFRFHKTRPIANFGYLNLMSMTLPLHEMTVPEKLRIMEALWEDLSRNADALESPGWHETVLQEREKRIVTGQTSFSDWERAKADIRRQAL
jgi:hypothetical protein